MTYVFQFNKSIVLLVQVWKRWSWSWWSQIWS